MNKFITMMLTLVVMLFAVNSFAWDPPTSPAPASWISDPSHILSPEAHARLDAKLKVINQSSANEVAALILPTLDGQDIADVGDKTAKAWGVGKKNLDNGVLVVLAMKEHKSRISTGKGVEGDLPDLKCNDILQNARPYLRNGNVEGALGFIFDSSSQAIANHKADVAAGRNTSTTTTTTSSNNNGAACNASNVGASGDDAGFTWLIVLSALAVGIWLFARSARRKRERLLQEQEEASEREAARLARQAAETTRSLAMQERKRREAELKKPTPTVDIPVVPRPQTTHRPTVHISTVPAIAAAAVTVAAEEEARAAKHRAEEARRRREREQDEEDRRRRQREEDDRRRSDDSSSSSSSSSDSGSWGGGGSDSGSGGFGGGDFGGGGSSGDW